MADGRHLENRQTAISPHALTDLHKIWHDDAFWPYEGYGQLKFPTFENPRWRTAAILRNCKRPYLRNGPTYLHKIRHGDAFWPSEGYGPFKFLTFKNPRWRTAAILKKRKRKYLRNALTVVTNLHKILDSMWFCSNLNTALWTICSCIGQNFFSVRVVTSD